MRIAVADPSHPRRPLYLLVLRMEEAIRQLDRVISENGPPITAEHPEDHGVEDWVAEMVVSLRDREP